ncbi:TMEM175 family protein [Macrococcus capreoli]|uniref:TMEM175 family protein n=1 Tax=Macrococcus capreoli TaxID=2982690 RepID=UPI0021D5C8F2|nr:TMEM175 family protein [Macrococcus sp. TMW 2.2395]MCU7558470.1 TMEM175 family protein [Macrococcus sp. TMW 2.2395]
MNKSRLEALTDAIIAIAATIMVLELKVPENNSLKSLMANWPIFLAYTISFFLIYIVWFNHHNIFKKAEIISTKTYLYNGVWTFFLTLVPFATAWIGEDPHATLPEIVYLVIVLLWSVSFQLMDHQIMKDNNVEKDITTHFLNRSLLYGGIILAAIISFVNPLISHIIFAISLIIIIINMFITKPKNK